MESSNFSGASGFEVNNSNFIQFHGNNIYFCHCSDDIMDSSSRFRIPGTHRAIPARYVPSTSNHEGVQQPLVDSGSPQTGQNNDARVQAASRWIDEGPYPSCSFCRACGAQLLAPPQSSAYANPGHENLRPMIYAYQRIESAVNHSPSELTVPLQNPVAYSSEPSNQPRERSIHFDLGIQEYHVPDHNSYDPYTEQCIQNSRLRHSLEWHYTVLGLDPDTDIDEPEAIESSPLHKTSEPASSPVGLEATTAKWSHFPELPEDSFSDSDYCPEPVTPVKQASPLSNTEKVKATLDFLRSLPRFLLRQFLETLFDSEDGDVKNFTSVFMASTGYMKVLDIWWNKVANDKDSSLRTWVIEKAGDICGQEASWLTNQASEGPNYHIAQSLRLRAKDVSVDTINNFRLSTLTSTYNEALPSFQSILKSMIAKEGPQNQDQSSKEQYYQKDAGRTMITSIVLNLRSHKTNYHAAMNSLLFWDNRVPKRLIQALNHFGITASHSFQACAIGYLSQSALKLAQLAANDPQKLKLLPYDNFNWVSNAWETSALHGNVTHDQVSALLIIMPTLDGLTAADVSRVSAFQETEGTRHRHSSHRALINIMPSSMDQKTFRLNAIAHVQQILTEEIQSLSCYQNSVPVISDPSALPCMKTEEYYLPTLDQEQGSTHGNMVVLEHYFGDILKIPKSVFETTMFTVLGDRLTTARDRAAQDQRAVDCSKHRFDHLSSIALTSGLMHFCLNFIHAIGGTWWAGKDGIKGLISLATLLDNLPNRSEINLRKVDYYAWQRFLDTILRALIVKAFMSALNILDTKELASDLIIQSIPTPSHLSDIATQIVDRFLVPSLSWLEADGVKTIPGSTESGNAVLLMHDLMSLHEMLHAIKHGHPERTLRMIKFWTPMFYSAGSYNYANESMELLHNVIHDWPTSYASVAVGGMFVTTSGRAGGFKPTDLHVEHLNDRIKERAHGSNATPRILEKVTPAMGHIQKLTDQLFYDLGVEQQNQKHSHVEQHKDVEILVQYLVNNNIFNFSQDTPTPHVPIDLFREGLHKLAGRDGGHQKHLDRHSLRLRTRHHDSYADSVLQVNTTEDSVDMVSTRGETARNTGGTQEDWQIYGKALEEIDSDGD
ncbi:hypothetical protein NP233_g6233 [Leucocoprinus birnbaumii]|uniref:DUF6589 domain-containing protein n=1 Tax=Leucocoprinus birnbaumii TaxID=56174 RepID=A0AAD5VRD3_9AGAR|nr:hypothetical protein NP233_g6233 [Leucocoprinus birnbaumii]